MFEGFRLSTCQHWLAAPYGTSNAGCTRRQHWLAAPYGISNAGWTRRQHWLAAIAVSTGWLQLLSALAGYSCCQHRLAALRIVASGVSNEPRTSCNCFQHWLAAKNVSTGMLQLLSALASCTTNFAPRQRQMSKQVGEPNVIATCQLKVSAPNLSSKCQHQSSVQNVSFRWNQKMSAQYFSTRCQHQLFAPGAVTKCLQKVLLPNVSTSFHMFF